MKNELLKDLYDIPPGFSIQKREIEESRRVLTEALDKPERRLVLQIVDAKDYIIENTSIDSFLSGFRLAWKLCEELNNDQNEHLISCRKVRGSKCSSHMRKGGRSMKELIMLTVITAYIALCAAVWPQSETVGETPEPTQELTINAPEAPTATHKEETEAPPQTEKENTEPPQPEPPMETVPEPEPVPMEIPVAHETQPIPKLVLKPVPEETGNTPQPGDMVYVHGFGWLESQGAGTVIHDEMIYENGNKVGSMD